MKFSVIIPVYDEGPAAAAAVRAVRGLRGGAEAELILSCAGPDAEALNPAEMPGVAFVKSPAGRAEQMNLGAQKASGEVLVFLHADTRLPAGAFQAMERALVPGGRCGGAFRLEIASRNPWLRFVAWTANVRNRFTGTPYGDQAIFMRSGFFRRLGGYARIPIMEDVDLVRRARGAGGRLVILREAAATSPRRWEKEGMLRTTLNHHALRLLYLGGVSAEKLAGFRAARGFAAKAACLFGRKARAGKEALVLFARYPFEGAVKTRLAAGLGERRTRGLYACFLRDAADELRRLKADIFVSFTPARAGREFREFLGADFNYLPQICGTLGERMENALREVFQKGVSRAVIVGSDLPGLRRGASTRPSASWRRCRQ
ncbi:MAG: TIGR04283 family arsenosugar biosynthesis glycosyltransferase [Elusimicrobiales bacterium]|jgi:rSAM/selenodomain-associated transferase 2